MTWRTFGLVLFLTCMVAFFPACIFPTPSRAPPQGVDVHPALVPVECPTGLVVEFAYRRKGTYRFEVVLDGVKTTCQATLPAPPMGPEACDGGDVILLISGSTRRREEQIIEGLLVMSHPKTVTVRGVREGAPLGEKTFDVAYESCALASTTFP